MVARVELVLGLLVAVAATVHCRAAVSKGYLGANMEGYKDPARDMADQCLFACSLCFKNDLLLACANHVCLRDLPMGKPLGEFWDNTCKGLGQFFKGK